MLLKMLLSYASGTAQTWALENVQTWYWTSHTAINSIAVVDIEGDTDIEIVTGGYYKDGTRNVAQLCVLA